MPLMRVRDLVKHASRHGYLVASFKIHGVEEAQAVVNAAETARASAIIAVDEQSPVMLRREITLAIAESLASSSSVPIAVEVVSHAQDRGLTSSRADSASASLSTAAVSMSPDASTAESVAVSESETDDWDREMWFASPAAAAEFSQAAHAGCRLGLIACDVDETGLRPAALRKQIQNMQMRHQVALVVDGDLRWSNATFRSLAGLGVTKVNFDKRLGQLMAKTYRRAAQKAGDHYRSAVEETFTALTGEVIEWLRRAGGSGRAADVMARVAGYDPGPVRSRAAFAANWIGRSARAVPYGTATLASKSAAWHG